jgi:hypothetical protein
MTDRGDGFHRINDLLEEYGRGRDAFAQRWDAPVLVRRPDPKHEVADQVSFHTRSAEDTGLVDEAIRQSGDRRRSITSELPMMTAAVPFTDDVVKLEKRIGGAFAERIGLGRAPNVDVQILLPKVSKYHAYVVIGEDGLVSIADAKSTFGTFVSGKRLEPLELTPLADSVDVRFATYEFRYHTAEGLLERLERMVRIRDRRG